MTNGRSANRKISRSIASSIFAGLILLSASAAVVRPEEVSNAKAQARPGTTKAPVGDRQAARPDVAGAPTGVGGVQPQENSLAKTIEQENERLDRLVRGICRGC
jgi:hypothetical protein